MIFRDLLEERTGAVQAAVKELFETAYANQTHPQDLLLVDQHGFFNRLVDEWSPPPGQPKLSPFMLGPHFIGLAEGTFYNFVDWYRKSHLADRADFEKEIARDPKMRSLEEMLIHIEQGIYLAFWESDITLKRLCQLTLLCRGKPYDWRKEMRRTRSRARVIREDICDPLRDVCPGFHRLIKETYRREVRNAIAHSQYFICDRAIHLLNPDPRGPARCERLPFDEWYAMFHNTLLLHAELIAAFNGYRERYKEATRNSHNGLEIRITHGGGKQEFRRLALRQCAKSKYEWYFVS